MIRALTNKLGDSTWVTTDKLQCITKYHQYNNPQSMIMYEKSLKYMIPFYSS